MSNVSNRLARPSSRQLLARVLDQPDLPTQIQSLAPVVFGKLVDHIGLQDAGELVALATTEQLAHAFDEDLWKSRRPGEDERFDADRFLVWLEVLLEAGDAFVASKLVEMPEDLVTLALHQHVLVLDVEALALSMQAADEVDARQLDKALESCLYEEVDGFQIMARDPDGWDSILSLVLALERDHHDFLQRVLEHCCAMTCEYIEDNGGLYQVLTSDQMLEADVAGDREDRRAEAGHVAPSSAAAFLELARTGSDAAQGERDPVTRGYFRNVRPSIQPKPQTVKSSAARLTAGKGADGLSRILRDAGVLLEGPSRHLLLPAAAKGDPMDWLLVGAMRLLGEQDARAFAERGEELAYLSNVLLAGCSFQQRSLRPIEAVRAALATCNLGLCLALPSHLSAGSERIPEHALVVLEQFKADGLFRSGWRRLHRDVVDAAARAALRRFEREASIAEGEARAAFERAGVALKRALLAGAPWRALAVLDDLLGAADGHEVDALRHWMDQLPTQPVASGGARGAHGKTPPVEGPRYFSTPSALHESHSLLERMAQAHEPGPVEEPPPAPIPAPSARTTPKPVKGAKGVAEKRRAPIAARKPQPR